jgi:ABC transporter substrate binding protein
MVRAARLRGMVSGSQGVDEAARISHSTCRGCHCRAASGNVAADGESLPGRHPICRLGVGSVPDAAFRSGLRERAYIEGQNILVEFRSALGKLDALPGLATELVALNLDVIFAPAEAALRSCLQASRTVPIVIASGDYDPVESGFVTNLARPKDRSWARLTPVTLLRTSVCRIGAEAGVTTYRCAATATLI